MMLVIMAMTRMTAMSRMDSACIDTSISKDIFVADGSTMEPNSVFKDVP
jgi:hypothetical protein